MDLNSTLKKGAFKSCRLSINSSVLREVRKHHSYYVCGFNRNVAQLSVLNHTNAFHCQPCVYKKSTLQVVPKHPNIVYTFVETC